ncbi:MAG: 2-nitropropane dioxygenase [Micrococcaceae bacterium]|nr:2-nitropropane dioxygenase [Micrococcaceae bacterium]
MFAAPIIVAPMAGGTSTPELVVAAARSGGLGFLAGGYLTPAALAAHIAAVRSAGVDFGVNVMVPGSIPPDPDDLRQYRNVLQAEADRYGVSLPPLDDPILAGDDAWEEKLDLLLSDPVPFVSFTFGLAPATAVARLQRAGSTVLASVTSVDEAKVAAATGVDALVVQHASAGSHTAAFLTSFPQSAAVDAADLVSMVREAVPLPLVGAGGLGSGKAVRNVLANGADAVQLGTAFLRTNESGARQAHKDALADPRFTETLLTRAFTGKPARALVNRFVQDHHDAAPDGYPAIHHLTTPIRAAAAQRGDADGLNLWAGTAWRQAQALPVAEVMAGFLGGL